MLSLAIVSFVPTSVYALSNTAYLTPPSGTSNPGKTFTISVDGTVVGSWLGTGSVKGTITFPTALLSVTNIDDSNATFSASSTVTNDDKQGKITFNQKTNGWSRANNQHVHFFVITFQALKAGTANVTFGNVLYDGFSSVATTGGIYTITTPAPTPSPTPSPSSSPSPSPSSSSSPKPSTSPKPSSSPSPSSSPTPQSDTDSKPSRTPMPTVPGLSIENLPIPESESEGGLKIENVKVSVTRQKNSVTWSINDPGTTPTFSYGTSKSAQNQTGDISQQEDGSYSTDLDGLKPGTLYYFSIEAASDDNLLGANYSGTLTTRGYPVQLMIEQNGLLLAGAKVKIGEREFVANQEGIIVTELSDGKFTATIVDPTSNSSYDVGFSVKKPALSDNQDLPQQKIVLNVSSSEQSAPPNTSLIPMILGGIAAVTAVIGLGVGLVLRRRHKYEEDMVSQADSDLLIASYGDRVNESRDKTPQPNLMGTSNSEVTTEPAQADSSGYRNYQTEQNSYSVPSNSDPADQGETLVPPIAAPAPSTQLDKPTSAAYNPTDSPLESTDSTTQNPSQNPYESSPATEQALEDTVTPEALQAQTDNNSASAVYDAATGQLDIIHGHEHANTFDASSTEKDEPLPVTSTVQRGSA